MKDKKSTRRGKGINFVGDVNAVVSTSTGGSGVSRTRVRSRIVQRSGETEVYEETHESKEIDAGETDR